MKKTLCYFICLVMVTLFFTGCVATKNRKSGTTLIGIANNLPVGELIDKEIFVNLGLFSSRWKKEEEGYSRGYIRANFPKGKAYYFQDTEGFIGYNVYILEEKSEQEKMSKERFLELVQLELDWYFRNWMLSGGNKFVTELKNIQVSGIPALFISSVNKLLADGRNQQLSFLGGIYKGREFIISFDNDQPDALKNNHVDEVLQDRIPQIVFQSKPFDNIS